MPFEPGDILNMHGQIDQDALRALIEQAAQSGGVMMGGGSYYQSPQGSTFVPVPVVREVCSYAIAEKVSRTSDDPDELIIHDSFYHDDGGILYLDRESGWTDTGDYGRDLDNLDRFTVSSYGHYIFGATLIWDDADDTSANGQKELYADASTTYSSCHSHCSSLASNVSQPTIQTVMGFSRLAPGEWVRFRAAQWTGDDRRIASTGHRFWIVRVGDSEVINYPEEIDGGDDDAS